MQTEEEKAVNVGFTRLLNMNRREWPYLFVGILASGAVGTVMPLFAVILSDLINGLTDVNTPASEILTYAIFFWGLGLGNFVCATIQVRVSAVPMHVHAAPLPAHPQPDAAGALHGLDVALQIAAA